MLGGVCTGPNPATHPNVGCPGGNLAGFGGLGGTFVIGNLAIPLSPVGRGSTAIRGNTMVSGAGWTTGSITVFTTGTTGTQTTTPGGDLIVALVSPIAVSAGGSIPSGAVIVLNLPEPATTLIGVASLVTAAALYRVGRRKQR